MVLIPLAALYGFLHWLLESYNKWCQHRIDQKWFREHPGTKDKPVEQWTLQELQEWSKRNYYARIRKLSLTAKMASCFSQIPGSRQLKSIRWFIFCALTNITGAKVFLSLIFTISILRWNRETTSAFGLTPIEFALLACLNIGIWTTIAAVSWTLRRAKDTAQRTPLKKFLMPIFLTVWVVGVLALFVYDKAATDATIKMAIPKLVEQEIQRAQ